MLRIPACVSCVSLCVSDQVLHPYKTTGKIIVVYILIFKFLDSKLEDSSRTYTAQIVLEVELSWNPKHLFRYCIFQRRAGLCFKWNMFGTWNLLERSVPFGIDSHTWGILKRFLFLPYFISGKRKSSQLYDHLLWEIGCPVCDSDCYLTDLRRSDKRDGFTFLMQEHGCWRNSDITPTSNKHCAMNVKCCPHIYGVLKIVAFRDVTPCGLVC
jgi:hypothetical protein